MATGERVIGLIRDIPASLNVCTPKQFTPMSESLRIQSDGTGTFGYSTDAESGSHCLSTMP
jgi:hypothetical protein